MWRESAEAGSYSDKVCNPLLIFTDIRVARKSFNEMAFNECAFQCRSSVGNDEDLYIVGDCIQMKDNF